MLRSFFFSSSFFRCSRCSAARSLGVIFFFSFLPVVPSGDGMVYSVGSVRARRVENQTYVWRLWAVDCEGGCSGVKHSVVSVKLKHECSRGAISAKSTTSETRNLS